MDCDVVGSSSSLYIPTTKSTDTLPLSHTIMNYSILFNEPGYIQRSSRKCGITVAIDGSEDHSINIRGLDNYQVELPVTTSEMDTLDTSRSDSNSDESTTSRSVRFGAEIMG